ncbi:MAG TPA: class I SAM-dependent methyltransferase [Lacipirellulaceae bacterium]|nr:class I SAM-dependent methyltransferase [Lacipirellulaceae bacterium]
MSGSLAEYAVGITDKNGRHRYCTLFYDGALAKYRHEPIELLEIGIASGGSIVMWHRYFNNARRIVGIDTNPSSALLDEYRQAVGTRAHNISVKHGDAYSSEISENFGSFDIIIDDGPHTLDSHLACLTLYVPKIKPGGLLVIEDIPDVNWVEAYERIVNAQRGLTCKAIDLRNEYKRLPDDLLFMVERHGPSLRP